MPSPSGQLVMTSEGECDSRSWDGAVVVGGPTRKKQQGFHDSRARARRSASILTGWKDAQGGEAPPRRRSRVGKNAADGSVGLGPRSEPDVRSRRALICGRHGRSLRIGSLSLSLSRSNDHAMYEIASAGGDMSLERLLRREVRVRSSEGMCGLRRPRVRRGALRVVISLY